jgi:hypothetical protein
MMCSDRKPRGQVCGAVNFSIVLFRRPRIAHTKDENANRTSDAGRHGLAYLKII